MGMTKEKWREGGKERRRRSDRDKETERERKDTEGLNK